MPFSSFIKIFLRLFIPFATQSLFANLISILDVLMVGQLGDASVAAVGLAGQFFFLLNLTLFGITGGAAVFAAQYWGAKDLPNMRRVQGLCLSVSLSVALAFACVALIFPGWVLSLYTRDTEVIALGTQYLRVIGWSYCFTAIMVVYASIVRSTGNTRLPMMVSIIPLLLNVAINYSLIFGRFGFPALGVQGAATGTTLCRILECLMMLGLVYSTRSPAAATPRQLFNLSLAFISRHLRLIFIVFLNEFVWALGINVYNAIFARLGTQAYAAYNIASTFQSLGLVVMAASITSSGIIIGHQIGAGEPDEAVRTGKRILVISALMSLAAGLGLVAARGPLMDLYRVSAAARTDAEGMILIVGLTLWLRNLDGMFVVGTLRSGGDTRYSAFLDVGAIWLAGIPAVALAAFGLHLPVQWVYVGALAESLAKSSLGLRRFLSRRWIRNLTEPRPISEMPGEIELPLGL